MDEKYDDDIETIVVEFDDLTPSLQEDAINTFQSDPYLVEDGWYDWLWEDYLTNTAEIGIDIESDSLSFDLSYSASIEYKGSMDFSYKKFSDLKNDLFVKFEDKEWIYDISSGFDKGDDIDGDYNVSSDIIYDDLEEEIFNNSVEIDGDEAVVELDTLSHIKKGIETYKDDIEDDKFIKELAGSLEAAELFFQEEIRVPEADYEEFLDDLVRTKTIQAETLVEEFLEQCGVILTEYKDKFSKNLQDSYDYHWDDEYARENLSGSEFSVEVDEEGNQLEILEKL